MPRWPELLADHAHRSEPLPRRPWILHMTWHEVLFAHWPLPAGLVETRIAAACGGHPAGMEVDRFDGQAWVGLVPFQMSNVGLRALPQWLGPHRFPELNLRTYVRADGRPGVFFFSLDAASRVAVRVARAWFALRYFDARFTIRHDGDALHYSCRRIHAGASAAELAVIYSPEGNASRSLPGTLEHWLTERYRLFSVGRRGRIYTGEIHHAPWPLQPARAEIRCNTLGSAAGLALDAQPALLHYAHELDVVAWGPNRVG